MSTFAVLVRHIEIFPHPNADLLELAKVDDYRCVVKKGEFKTGDLVAYIPEASLVPAPLLAEMGLTGRLAGSEKNRVKAVKLRGEVSQGLVYPARPHWKEGDDVTAELGIVKWIPPIPVHLAGELAPAPEGWHGYTDIENIKRYPNVLQPGEEVVATEKVHGTCTLVGLMNGVAAVSSKGYGAGGKVIKEDEKNLYWRMARKYNLFEKMEGLSGAKGAIMLFGETFGTGVQDLGYGMQKGEPNYFAFDMSVNGRYLDYDDFVKICTERGIPMAHVLYRGPFGPECLAHAKGRETISGKEVHMREGIVIRPIKERYEHDIGRVILKSVNEEYLLRGGEATEFE
ncbi:RNA ligase (ATP) [candidate division KSB1 bacterium]|nr:RNA ligase (ATP) [candidate division KSB1 bacterium]